MKKTPRGIGRMADGRYRLFAVAANHKRIRPIVSWDYLKLLGVQIPEDNRQGEPGIALAVAAQTKLKADIAEEKKTGAVMANAKTKVGDLLALVEQDYGRKARKSISHVQTRWNNHLKSFFTDLWANQLSSDDIDRYIALRQRQKAANATICRELSLIRRMLRLGMRGKSPKVRSMPHFDLPKESDARQGFLSDSLYDKLAQACSREGLWLRGMFAVGCSFGWRKSEVLNLQVCQLDFSDRTIRLDAGATKNSDGRVVKMTKDVAHILAACVAGKTGTDYVVTRDAGRHKGKRVRDFRVGWASACERAGCAGLLFHDLRRTGARNLRRLGVSEKTIMEIGGWRTREVFERYNIIDVEDLEDAARRLDEKRDRELLEKAASDAAKQATSALKSATESQLVDELPVVQSLETVRIQ
jgi:integrase